MSSPRKRLVFALACLFQASLLPAGFSAPGDLDLSFSGDGKRTIDVGMKTSGVGRTDEATGVIVQPNGKIVISGWVESIEEGSTKANFAATRLLPDGSLDPTFGEGGVVSTHVGDIDIARDIVQLANGKFVLFGEGAEVYPGENPERMFAAVRYNANGTIDDNTDGSGWPEGKFGLMVPDATEFGNAAARDGAKVVLAGTYGNGVDMNGMVIRLTADGFLNNGALGDSDPFGINGFAEINDGLTDDLQDVAVQDDHKIVVAGTFRESSMTDSDFFIQRFLPTSANDNEGFGEFGRAEIDFGINGDDRARALALGPGGTIYVGGSTPSHEEGIATNDFALARLTSAGTLDETWGGNGRVITPIGDVDTSETIFDLAVQPDGRVVAIGQRSSGGFVVARYLPNGELDPSFAGDGLTVTNFGEQSFWGSTAAEAVALQDNGRIVVVGDSRKDYGSGSDVDFAVARYRDDKSATTTNLQIEKSKAKIFASGKVKPPHPGSSMTIRLERKNNAGEWRFLSGVNMSLDSDSAYGWTFDRPAAGTCKVTAKFPGDLHHLGSKAIDKFAC